MGSVKEILMRVLSAHYEDTKSRMAEAFGVGRGTAGRWFTHGSVPEYGTCEAIEAKHPAEADGLVKAWRRESKQTSRSERRIVESAPAAARLLPAPSDLTPLWDKLDDARRAALKQVASDLVRGGPGVWYGPALERLAGAADGAERTARPLSPGA